MTKTRCDASAVLRRFIPILISGSAHARVLRLAPSPSRFGITGALTRSLTSEAPRPAREGACALMKRLCKKHDRRAEAMPGTAVCYNSICLRSGDGDALVEVNVLNQVQQFHAFLQRTLERLAPGNQSCAAGALVDDGRLHRRREIARALGFAAGIDESRPAGVTVQNLIPAKVNRMVGGQFRINALINFAIAAANGGGHRLVTAVVLRQFLLDDVGFDGDAEVIGLSGEVGADVKILFLGLERAAAQVAPQDGGQAEFMRALEGEARLHNLPRGFRRTEINRRAHGDRAHVPRLFDLARNKPGRTGWGR